DGKSAPLVAAPGSHLQLDNVRMERTGEWRRRHGWAQDPNDTIQITGGVQVVRAVELPGGGILALTEASADANTCARLYSPTASPRWTLPPQFLPQFGGAPPASGSGQASLSVWSRHQVGYTDNPQPFVTLAEGNGIQLIAWAAAVSPTNATALFKTVGEDKSVGTPFTFVGTPFTTTATRPRAVYFPGTPGTFALFWIEGANLWGQTFSGNGVHFGVTLISTDVAAGSSLDAVIYGASATATVAYQGAAGRVKALEVTSVLTVTSTGVGVAVGSQCVQLLPDPDGSGTRLVASAAPNAQQVTRFCSAGAVLTTSDVGSLAGVTVTGFAGVAVNAGQGAVLVFQTATGGIWATKMVTSASVGVPSQIIPDATGIYIDSNGWREPGTDAMHWIAGLHIGLPGTTFVSGGKGTNGTDFQHTFYEMALEYGGVVTVANQFSEPQARLIPLQAGPPAGCDKTGSIFPGAQVQVVRTGAGAFSLPLFRLTRFDTGAASQIANPLQYAVDRWDVLHLNGANGVNLGRGLKASSASYLPAGQLLQTVDGQQVVGHGASALPYQPTLGPPRAGGALTQNSSYGTLIVVEMSDESGNVWRSTPSIPAWIALTGTQTAFDVKITLTPLESPLRVRTVKYYRTVGNGSVYFLAWKQSNPANPISFTDELSDAQLGTQLITALSSGDVGEQPATVTPAFSHVVLFDGRLWGIDRDFPTQVWYSKPIVQGASPEFPSSFRFDMPDELGPLTGMAACDDKLVLFKSPRGIYYVPQGGPDNTGGGNQYMPVRLSSEVGLLSGQPYVSTGSEVYFGSSQGIYRLNGSLGIDFVGMPIDQYLGQPHANTPDTLLSATYNDAKNEIRFLGAASHYVFDRLHNLWVRDTFQAVANTPIAMLTVASQDVMFRSDGTMWTEGTDANLDDPAAVTSPYQGAIRSVWYRPAEMGGYMRLYSVRLLLDLLGEG